MLLVYFIIKILKQGSKQKGEIPNQKFKTDTFESLKDCML